VYPPTDHQRRACDHGRSGRRKENDGCGDIRREANATKRDPQDISAMRQRISDTRNQNALNWFDTPTEVEDARARSTDQAQLPMKSQKGEALKKAIYRRHELGRVN
jgi:hypothetical protein